VGLPRDLGPELPPRPGAGVDLEGTSHLPLREAEQPALGYQPTGERPFIDRLRVVVGYDPCFWQRVAALEDGKDD
jgi:hypothetical protein